MPSNTSVRKKICFVLPEYTPHTHFMYVAAMIEALAADRDIFLIVEKGKLPEQSAVQRKYLQKFTFFPLRLAENFFVLCGARMRGYKEIYVHYSFAAAINASLVARASGGTSYYWNAGMPWLYARPFRREAFERLAYKLISVLVTGAESLRHGYADYYHISPGKIKIISNWIDAKEFTALPADFNAAEFRKSLAIPSDKKIALFDHRLARRKGSYFLPAIAEAIGDQAVLVIIGDGPDRADLERDIREKKLQASVRILGWILQKDIKKYFAIADIFVMPSEEEGFPHVILEAMAAGVPYAAFNVGGMPDIATPLMKKYLYEPGDIAALNTGSQQLLRDDAERMRLAADAKKRAEDFSKERVAELYKKLLNHEL